MSLKDFNTDKIHIEVIGPSEINLLSIRLLHKGTYYIKVYTCIMN